jgi:integrase
MPAEGLPIEPVFKVYSNQSTNSMLKDIMKLAGINKPISYHCSRHTFATLALELCGDSAPQKLFFADFTNCRRLI